MGGLASTVDDEGLNKAFASYGTITEAYVVNSRNTTLFGFVTFSDAGNAAKAIDGMNGKQIQDAEIEVTQANLES